MHQSPRSLKKAFYKPIRQKAFVEDSKGWLRDLRRLNCDLFRFGIRCPKTNGYCVESPLINFRYGKSPPFEAFEVGETFARFLARTWGGS
jgi:hypothetical protein